MASLNNGNAASISDVWALLNNDFDTFLTLPEDKPLHYALSYDFAFTLAEQCPGIVPPNYKKEQELTDEMYVAFVIYYQAANIIYDAQFKGQRVNSISELIGKVTAAPAKVIAPVSLHRAAINPTELVNQVLSDAGGCNSERVQDVAKVLTAIGTFGTLPSPPTTATETLQTFNLDEGSGTLKCYYNHTENPALQKVQEYYYPTVSLIVQYASLAAWMGMHLNDLNSMARAMRWECPQTLDSERQGWDTRTTPYSAELSTGSSKAERMADYFIDVYVPGVGAASLRREVTATKEELNLLRQEIIKLESIELSEEEIQTSYAELVEKLYKQCVEGNPRDWCDSRDHWKPDIKLHRHRVRLQKFKELYGSSSVFSMEEGQRLMKKGVFQYLAARLSLVERID